MTPVAPLCAACRSELKPDDLFCPACGRVTADTADVRCEAHPDTAAGAACVVCGCPVCSRCAHQVQGVTVCDHPDHESVHAQWRVVEEIDDPFVADILTKNLILNSFPAQAFDHHAHASRFRVAERSRVRVYVRAEHLSRAADLLTQLDLHLSGESPAS